jgi:hypothetical protein
MSRWFFAAFPFRSDENWWFAQRRCFAKEIRYCQSSAGRGLSWRGACSCSAYGDRQGETRETSRNGFLLPALCNGWAAPNPSDYNLNVHVSAIRMLIEGNSLAHHQNLRVVIDGKKYEMESVHIPNALLILGDYKARLVKDQHWAGTYDSWRVYEFLFPDKRTRQFVVVGEAE